jgi:hypothetical protein
MTTTVSSFAWYRNGMPSASGRLPAAIPGDKDAIEADLWSLRLGNEEEVPARSEENDFDQPLGIHCAIGTQRHEGIDGARLAGRDSGDVAGQHIEPPNLDRPLQLFESLGE